MKIVILDKNTVSYGDVDFKEIEALGETAYFNRLPPDKVAKACTGAEAVLINKTVLTREIIFALPSLKYIGTFATGYNNVDVAACRERGVTLCNAPAYSTHAVAQHAIALMLCFAGSTNKYISSVAEGKWILSESFSYYAFPQYEVYGKTFAVIGYGEIGRATAKIAEALGMEVIVSTRTPPKDCPYELVTKEEAFKRADYLSFHCPLNEGTKLLVNKDTLALMKKSAVIINTARGGLIDEEALASALNGGRIRGACLDVLAREPMSADNPLYSAKNCLITPHVAWLPVETRKRLIHTVAQNLKAYIEGRPVNVIK